MTSSTVSRGIQMFNHSRGWQYISNIIRFALCNGCNYFSLHGLKLTHISKMAPVQPSVSHLHVVHIIWGQISSVYFPSNLFDNHFPMYILRNRSDDYRLCSLIDIPTISHRRFGSILVSNIYCCINWRPFRLSDVKIVSILRQNTLIYGLRSLN